MAEVQICGIKKDNGNHENPHEAISHYQWIDVDNSKKLTARYEMVKWAKTSGNRAYVGQGSNRAYCQVRSNGRIEFLQTVSDGYYSNNLLSLDEV